MKQYLLIFSIISLCLSLVACEPKEKKDYGHGELNLVSLSPTETFMSVQRAVLNNDAEEVYRYYSEPLRMVQDLEDLKSAFKLKREVFQKRYTGARILPNSMQYISDIRAVCRIRWGDDTKTVMTFTFEEDGWKLGRELVALETAN